MSKEFPKVLFLILRKPFFKQILEGSKKTEYRDFTSYFISRLCDLDKEDTLIDTKTYDKVLFQLGYAKDAPQMMVECKGVFIETDRELADDEPFNEDNAHFAIDLGEILETINCDHIV